MANPTLKASFDLDGSKFEKSMGRIKGSAKKSVKEIESLGSGGSGAFGGTFGKILGLAGTLIGLKQIDAQIEQTIFKMRKLRDDSAQTGLDAESLQKIENIGGNVEDVRQGLESLAEAQAKILGGADGDLKLTKAFARLGVSLTDLKSKTHQSIFTQIADGMKDAEASAENLAALKATLGSEAGKLLPVFRRGLDSEEANAGISSNRDVEELNKLDDAARKASVPRTVSNGG